MNKKEKIVSSIESVGQSYLELNLKDVHAILSGKKYKKKVDEDKIKIIIEAKNIIAGLIESLENEVAKSYFQVSELEIQKITEGLADYSLQIEEIESLNNKVEIAHKVRALCTHLAERTGDMDQDSENPGIMLKASLEKLLQSENINVDTGLLHRNKIRIAELCNKLKLKDEALKHALEKIDMVCWLQEASNLLASPLTDSSELEELHSRAPKAIYYHLVYIALANRLTKTVQSPKLEIIEKDVHAALCAYFNRGEDILECKDEIKKFIERTRKKSHSEKIERLLSVTENLLRLYEKSDMADCDSVIEDLFELKFHSTIAFHFVEVLQKNIEKLRREIAILSAPRPNKSAEKANKHKGALFIMRELERPEVSRARELIVQINQLPNGVKETYSEVEENLKSKVEAVDKFRGKMKDLKTKYQKFKLVTGKVDTLVSEFEKLVKEYCQLDFGCDEYRREIEKYSWMVKANCALEGKPYDGSGKSIESWKKLLENVKEWGGTLTIALENKLQFAKGFVREVDKLKAALNNPRTDKEKLLTLKEAEELLKELNKNCREIDIGPEKNILEGIVAGVQAKLKLLQPGHQLFLHELVNCMDFLKRAALNLKEEISPLTEIEKKASEFLQRVRELSPEQFIQKQFEFQGIYESLGVKVVEWEDMIASVLQEEKVIERINANINSGMVDLASAQDIREQYKDIKYQKDIRLETNLMVMYLQLLRTEFEKRQDGNYREDTAKPAIDYLLLSVLIQELEDLTYRLKTSDSNFKTEIQNQNELHRFVQELFNDVKRHLEYSVYSLSLEGLNTYPPKKLYKKFVDITGPILDYKINLEFQEREKIQKNKMLFPSKESNKRQALLLESKYSRDKDSVGPPAQHMGYGTTVAHSFDERKISGLVKSPLDSSLADTGSKPNHHPFRDEPESVPVKPDVGMSAITEDLRNYYQKNWKKLMESNSHLEISGLDALMASKSLEKAIYDKIKKNPLEYDVFCTSITNSLRHIIQFKSISIHLRNEGFKPSVLIVYCDKPLAQLRKMDFALRNTERITEGIGSLPSYNILKKKPYTRDTAMPSHSMIERNRVPDTSISMGIPRVQPPQPESPQGAEEPLYKNYNIFTGSFTVEIGDKAPRAFDDVTMMTCSGYERIIQFSEIPNKALLSTKIDKTYFVNYITGILAKPSEYKFLTGWVTYKKTHTPVSSYMVKHDCVASQQYSQNCKVFIFMVNSMSPEWLAKFPIYTSSGTIEMVFFLVHKKRSEVTETPIVPIPVSLTSANAYRFVAGATKIGLKPTSLDRIREITKPQVQGTFGDKFNDGDGDEEAHRAAERSAKTSKLQFLIDQAGHIKKVPNFLIEEEARLDRHKLVDTNYEEESIIEEDEPPNSKMYKGSLGYSQAFGNSLSKQAMLEDRTNNYGSFSAIAGIDKEEFVRNAVNQITLPPHAILGAGLR